MNTEKAIKYIDVYLDDYCTDRQIKEDWAIHVRFVKKILLSIREQLEY